MGLGCIEQCVRDGAACNSPSVCSLNSKKINLRIACEEAGYPMCEARYTSVQDYTSKTGLTLEDV